MDITLTIRVKSDSNDFKDIRTLTVPLTEILRLYLRPLRWLSFVAYGIAGVRGSLHLPSRPDYPLSEFDYDQQNNFASEYLYIIGSEILHFIDPLALNETLTHTSATREGFRQSIVDRDGRCPFTWESPPAADAVHFLSIKKGDQYAEDITTPRAGSPSQIIEKINDPRNGMLLAKHTHGKLFKTLHKDGTGPKSTCMILCTPNFVLKSSHVPTPLSPLHPSQTERTDSTIKLMSLQYILKDANDPFEGAAVAKSHNLSAINAAWGPGDDPASDSNPSRLVLDFLYGCTVYQRWKHPEMEKHLSTLERKYPALLTPTQRPKREIEESRANDKAKRDANNDARTARNSEMNDASDAIDLHVRSLFLRDLVEGYKTMYSKEAAELREANERNEKEKAQGIREWANQVHLGVSRSPDT